MKRPSSIWVIIVANLIGLLVLAFVYPSAMVSPGALVPAHAELAGTCFACHAPFRGAAPERCLRCHAGADLGVRTTGGAPIERSTARTLRVAFHQELSDQNCSSCHSDHGRPTEPRFSHALLGPAARGDCASCHAAPTNDLHRDLRANCTQCHTTEHWSPATFDHAVLSSATLARCESCHAAPTDSFHRQVAAACTQCHLPPRWKPSTFNHDRFFLLDRDHHAPCATCHVNNDVTRYTCFGCHEHTPANVRAEHAEEGIRNIDNCVSCHRSADGEAGEHGEGRERGKGREHDEH
jgi:hypothetical protein